MRSFLEQAFSTRQTASEIRKHAPDRETPDLILALKLAEKLEARAAELEYRWWTLGPAPKRRDNVSLAARLRRPF
jgi:hypothetical protein